MAIKQLLQLIGDDIVISKLDAVQKKGEQALGAFNKSTPDLQVNIPDAKPIQDFSDQTIKLKDALHALRPILQAAGIQFSEFGGLVRLASTSLIGLGVATAGALVVGLARLEEQTAATKGKLTDLFGSAGAGERAFNQLKQGADGLGTNVEKLAPALESAKIAVDSFIASSSKVKFVALPGVDLPAGTAQNLKNIGDAVLNFFKLLRAGRLDADEAAKADKAFFDAVKQGGTVTADILRTLPTGTVQLLADAMGRGAISAQQFITEVALVPIPVNKLVEALSRFGTQAQTAFDTKAIKGTGDALSNLLTTLTGGFEKLSGTKFSDFVVGEINAITKGIKDSIQELQDFKQVLDDIGATAAFKKVLADAEKNAEALKKLRPAAQPLGPEFNEAFGFVIPPAQKEQIQQQFEELGKEGTQSFAKGFRSAPSFFTAQDVKDFLGQDVIAQAQQAGIEAGTNVVEGFQTNVPEVLTLFQTVYQGIVSLFATPIPFTLQGDTRNPLQSTAPFAGGGMVRGPGSTTSDSILAWLSNREYVVSARAVSHYGADLFAALNSMRLPRDFIGGFSMGGLARAISGNRFAAGGQVSAGHPVVLNIDRHSFNMSAGGDTIAQLKRFAVTSQLSSTGRKPRWVK